MDWKQVPMLGDLLEHPEKLSDLPVEAIPAMRGELARLDTLLQMRIVAVQNSNGAGEPEPDRLLTADDAARLLGVTPRWLRSRAMKLPFARKLSRKCLRFSETGIRTYQVQMPEFNLEQETTKKKRRP